jgi:hypothetical protein
MLGPGADENAITSQKDERLSDTVRQVSASTNFPTLLLEVNSKMIVARDMSLELASHLIAPSRRIHSAEERFS